MSHTPAGMLVASLLGAEPGQEVRGDLRRFKQVIETGEVVLSDASWHRGAHPARPAETPFRLRKPVPGAGPAAPAHGQDAVTHDAWPAPDDHPARRADAGDVAAAAVSGGTR